MKTALYLCVFLMCVMAGYFTATLGNPLEAVIINLPQDQGKWYISVVDSPEVVAWFNTDKHLQSLKGQVHFINVSVDSPVYEARYKDTIRALPTIRLQKPDGTTPYETWGRNIPASPEVLYSAMYHAVKNNGPYVLPYRRNHEHPAPDVEPVPEPEPDLSPILPEPDDGGTPDLVEPVNEIQARVVLLLIILCAIAGAVGGVAYQWKKTYNSDDSET